MTVQEILDRLETVVPLTLSESWDNSGFQLGDLDAHVERVAFALDATTYSVSEALTRGCELLITHHPLFFHPLSHLDLSQSVPQVCAAALRGNMAIASWHSCWDAATGGVNEGLLRRAGLQNRCPFSEGLETTGFGLGGVGSWKISRSMSAATEHLAQQWNLSGWQFWGDLEAKCSTVALCGGSGGEFWPRGIAHGADLYVTSEMKHHQIHEALAKGINLMICDHGEMEEPSMKDLADLVETLCAVQTTLIVSPTRHQLQWFSRH